VSEQDNIQVVKKWFDAVNAHDLNGLEKCRAPGYACEGVGLPGLAGAEEEVATIRANWDAFPDARTEVLRTIAQGDYVVANGMVTGTHQRPFKMADGQDIPATGKRMSIPVSETFEFDKGRIAHRYMYFDMLGAMAQLGLAPQP